MYSLPQTLSLAPTVSDTSHLSLPQQMFPWTTAAPCSFRILSPRSYLDTALGFCSSSHHSHPLRQLCKPNPTVTCSSHWRVKECPSAEFIAQQWNLNRAHPLLSLARLFKLPEIWGGNGLLPLASIAQAMGETAAVFGTLWNLCTNTRNHTSSKWKGQHMGHSSSTSATRMCCPTRWEAQPNMLELNDT